MSEQKKKISNALTEPQLRAARLIAMGEAFDDVARHLQVNRSTLYRWRKLASFSVEIGRLVNTLKEENRARVVRDVGEINDIILTTLVEVAENDSSGSARVAAARVLVEMVERVEVQARQASHNIMTDQSSEIRLLLEEIKSHQVNIDTPV